MNFFDPTGHTMAGDEKLSDEDQQLIDQYTDEYNAAKAAGNKEDMNTAHENADKVRAKYITEVYIINRDEGGGVGHNAILLVNSTGQSFYFSYYPENMNSGGSSGSAAPLDTPGAMRTNTLDPQATKAFLNSGSMKVAYTNKTNVSGELYNNYIKVEVSKANGYAAYTKGMSYFHNPGTYSLLHNNCTVVASKIADKAGLNMSSDIRPNNAFCETLFYSLGGFKWSYGTFSKPLDPVDCWISD